MTAARSFGQCACGAGIASSWACEDAGRCLTGAPTSTNVPCQGCKTPVDCRASWTCEAMARSIREAHA